MSPLEIRLLNSFTSFLGRMDDFIDHHPVIMTIGVLYLFMLFVVFMIVHVVLRRAKGLINPGPRIIFIESSTPPPPPAELPFDPFPLRRDCDCERNRDD